MTPAPQTPQTTTTVVEAPWGCRVESKMTKTEEGRIDFSNITQHVRGASVCKCRRNPDPMQEGYNEERVARYAHNLWTSGQCSLVEMLDIFAKLKLGLPVQKEAELHWDEENKVWGERPQQGERPEASKDAPGTFAVQVSSEENTEAD